MIDVDQEMIFQSLESRPFQASALENEHRSRASVDMIGNRRPIGARKIFKSGGYRVAIDDPRLLSQFLENQQERKFGAQRITVGTDM